MSFDFNFDLNFDENFDENFNDNFVMWVLIGIGMVMVIWVGI